MPSNHCTNAPECAPMFYGEFVPFTEVGGGQFEYLLTRINLQCSTK